MDIGNLSMEEKLLSISFPPSISFVTWWWHLKVMPNGGLILDKVAWYYHGVTAREGSSGNNYIHNPWLKYLYFLIFIFQFIK
jgi:hypothetical protein